MSKWYSFKELKRARTPMLLDSETGLPDNHVITVVERVISVDDSELIQNNVRTDTFTLNLDAEYDDLNVVVIFTKPNNINVKVAYNGTPTHIPGSAMELVGSLACSVVGIDADGEVRAVTKAAPDTFQVVESGAYDGSVTSDDAELLGQILQAVSDAEAAITEAETATTAATNATSQATSAATSANQAASSANSAASSANSAATRATSAAVNAENAYETLQPYMATIDSCANILHREVGPDAVVTADDSFPAKPVEMVVYGNTVQNLWVNPSGTKAGVTVTSNENGSMTLSGTSTAYSINEVESYVLRAGSTYTASIDGTLPSGASFRIRLYDSGSWVRDLFARGSGSATFTVPSDGSWTAVRFVLVVENGITVSGTYRVMLNEGSAAEPWCPPGLNSVGQLREDEKNLWVNPTDRTTSGVTLTNNDDGSFTVSGTNTAGGAIYMGSTGPFALETGKTYTMSIDGDPDFSAYVNFRDSGNSLISSVSVGSSSGQTSTTFSLPESTSAVQMGISVQAGVTVSSTYKAMLNEGSTAKPWVSPESEGCVQVVTAGKNLLLLNPNLAQSTVNGVTFTPQDDGGILVNGTNNGAESVYYNLDFTGSSVSTAFGTDISALVGSEVVASGNKNDVNVSCTFFSADNWFRDANSINGAAVVVPAGAIKLRSFLSVSIGKTVSNVVVYPQVELGSTATAYEPPSITTTRIDLRGHTLNALPDGTRDELHIDGGGNVVLEKRTGTYIANGDEGWELSANSNAPYRMMVEHWSEDVKSALLPINQFQADRLPKYPNSTQSGSNFVIVNGWYQLYAARDGIQDASAFSEWLESNPMTVIYPLAEPQTIDLGTITPPTMAAPNVTAYVADDTSAEMELDYVRDINIVVDRLEKKVADLVVTEATIV